MRNFLFWKFPKTARAKNGKFPNKARSGFLSFWELFLYRKRFGKFTVSMASGVHWSELFCGLGSQAGGPEKMCEVGAS